MAPPRQNNICQRVAQLRMEAVGPRGKAAFAKALGLSPSTYDYYERTRVPPADVLVTISQRTGADLYWLLTGKATAPEGVGADHPLVQRVARLLADRPDSAGPLAAFLDILSGVQAFPKAQEQVRAPESPAPPVMAASGAAEPQPPGPQAATAAKGGWVPILGRTAAGVAHFWADGRDAEGVTMLAELVERYAAAPGASVSPAAVEREGAAAETVEVIALPAAAELDAAEFVAARAMKARYPDAFALRIDGESMAPDIRHGDIVILSPSVPAGDGRAAVVQLAGQIGVICKLYRRVGDQVHLIPIHERFAVQTFPASKVIWALAVLARVRV